MECGFYRFLCGGAGCVAGLRRPTHTRLERIAGTTSRSQELRYRFSGVVCLFAKCHLKMCKAFLGHCLYVVSRISICKVCVVIRINVLSSLGKHWHCCLPEKWETTGPQVGYTSEPKLYLLHPPEFEALCLAWREVLVSQPQVCYTLIFGTSQTFFLVELVYIFVLFILILVMPLIASKCILSFSLQEIMFSLPPFLPIYHVVFILLLKK